MCGAVLFCVVQNGSGDLPTASDLASARSSQRSGNAIPVIAASTSSSSSASLSAAVPDLSGPADGFCLPLDQLVPAAAAVGGGPATEDSSAAAVAVGALLQALTESHTAGGQGCAMKHIGHCSSVCEWVAGGARVRWQLLLVGCPSVDQSCCQCTCSALAGVQGC